MIKRLGKENIIKSILVVLIILSFFVMYKEYKNYQPIESIRVKETKVNKKQFAMYKENDNGEYEVYDNDTFPTNGYKLNLTESYCVDKNQSKVDGVLSIDNNKPKVTSDKTVYCYLYYDKEIIVTFDYTGGEQEFIVPKTGTYKIELWGTYRGAYVKGNIYLLKDNSLYLYIGQNYIGHVDSSLTNYAYNGGGQGGYFTIARYYYRVDGGGGATDIRLVNGNWNNGLSLRSRIMVAGAGSNGAAGGLIGYIGELWNNAGAGTQVSGGAAGGSGATAGGFGYGGNGYNSDPVNPHRNEGFGGASGYYGGGGGYGGTAVQNVNRRGAGGGGSSYISGHTGCVAIESANSLTPRLDSNGVQCSDGTTDIECSKHYSGYVFTDTLMIDGLGYKWTHVKEEQQQMPNPDGGYYNLGVGHSGNGYARITYMG